jgi:hypothetical protein
MKASPASLSDHPRLACFRMQLQVMGMLSSMRISFPSRVRFAINVANMANLDLVSNADFSSSSFACESE